MIKCVLSVSTSESWDEKKGKRWKRLLQSVLVENPVKFSRNW